MAATPAAAAPDITTTPAAAPDITTTPAGPTVEPPAATPGGSGGGPPSGGAPPSSGPATEPGMNTIPGGAGAPTPLDVVPDSAASSSAADTTPTGGGDRGGGSGPPGGDGGGLPPDFGPPNDLTFEAEGPLVEIPTGIGGEPARVLEAGAGPQDTNLGLPPEPGQGNPAVVDPNLVDLSRTDVNARPGVTVWDATQPPPPELQGQDTLVINNPRGYNVDIGTVGQSVRPGGRIIIQGRAEVVPGMRPANPNMTRVLEATQAGVPSGFRVVEIVTDPTVPVGDPNVVPRPPAAMGGPFNRTAGGNVSWPNTRIVIERVGPGAPPGSPPSSGAAPPAAGGPSPILEGTPPVTSGTSGSGVADVAPTPGSAVMGPTNEGGAPSGGGGAGGGPPPPSSNEPTLRGMDIDTHGTPASEADRPSSWTDQDIDAFVNGIAPLDAGGSAESGTFFELPGQNPRTGEGLQGINSRIEPNPNLPTFNENMHFSGIGDVRVVDQRFGPQAPRGPGGSVIPEGVGMSTTVPETSLTNPDGTPVTHTYEGYTPPTTRGGEGTWGPITRPMGTRNVEVRTHGANPNAPVGSLSNSGQSTQLNTPSGRFGQPHTPGSSIPAPVEGQPAVVGGVGGQESMYLHDPYNPNQPAGGRAWVQIGEMGQHGPGAHWDIGPGARAPAPPPRDPTAPRPPGAPMPAGPFPVWQPAGGGGGGPAGPAPGGGGGPGPGGGGGPSTASMAGPLVYPSQSGPSVPGATPATPQYGATVGGVMAGAFNQGARGGVSGAAQGALIGTVLMPGMGTAIGAEIGGAIGAAQGAVGGALDAASRPPGVTVDPRTGAGAELVNPNYKNPPGTPQQIAAIRADIARLRQERSQSQHAETVAQQQAQQGKDLRKAADQAREVTQQGTQKATQTQTDATQKESTNQQAQGQQNQSQEQVGSYRERAAGLAVLTGPLNAFRGFLHYAEMLPGDVGAKFHQMDTEAASFQRALGQVGIQMAQTAAQGPAALAAWRQEQQQLVATRAQGQSGQQQFQQQTQQATQIGEKADQATASRETMATRAASHGAQVQGQIDKGDQRATTLAAQLNTWAAEHKEERTRAIEQTRSQYEARGYKVTVKGQ
jgi:hypothetical protein